MNELGNSANWPIGCDPADGHVGPIKHLDFETPQTPDAAIAPDKWLCSTRNSRFAAAHGFTYFYTQ